jgi:hypothetical protein
MVLQKQHIICGICKKLVVFQIPRDKQTLANKLFVINACIWSDKGALKYIRYINASIQLTCLTK